MLKPLPMRMTSPSEARCRPWLLRHDPHVVAVQPEVLVEVADVLVDPAGHRVDVRRDEPDLHRRTLVRRGFGSRSAAVERARRGSRGRDRCRPGGPDRGPRRGRRGRTSGAGGRTSRPGCPWRGSCRGVGGPRLDRRAQVVRVAARERGPAGADRLGGVGVAVADRGQPVLDGEPDARGACHGRPSVVGLNVSSASGWKRGSDSASSRRSTKPWAHSGIRDERVGRDRQPALVVDLGDRRRAASAAA